jgi:hypothetical protein
MRSSKHVSWISLMLCVAALALPACGGGSSSPDTSGTAAALTNKLDDDKDGRVDEGDEGKDEDEDGKVDEASEHEDACAAHGHHGMRVAASESHEEEAADSDESAEADEAADTDESTDMDKADEDDAAEAEHHSDKLDCSDIVESDKADTDDADEGV